MHIKDKKLDTDHIKSIRIKLGLKQTELAKKMRIASSSYSNKENGDTDFTIREAIIFADEAKNKIPDITIRDIFIYH